MWRGSISSVPGSAKFERRSWRRRICSAGIGEGTDVVGKEMYSQDRGDRSCTLRPEGTASVVRWYQHGFSQGAQKLCAVSMFAVERPQAGRQRQFHQIGGVARSGAGPGDVEVIALAWDLLASLGVGGLQLELNSLGTSRTARPTARLLWLGSSSSRPSMLIPRRG